jgi:predicted AlkP superfamily pyrophosphatase or phosphodiesterase
MIGIVGRVRRLVLFAALCVFLPACAAAPLVEHVFIISIDGGSPASIERSAMPVLQKLVKQGAHTWSAQTITPSLTLPAHASMLTGVGMDRHKVTWNDWSPTNGFAQAPTVFAAAKPAGISTAMFVGKEKFRHLAQPGTVDEFNYDSGASQIVSKSASGGGDLKKEGNVFAQAVAANAASYIARHKPGLCFIHFADPDSAGHKYGWGSPEQLASLADVDAGLGVILKAIR